MLEMKNVGKNFNDNVILKNFNIAIPKGKIVGIIGPSGCGKSTILKIISGLEKSNRGIIEKNFNNLGYIFQEPNLLKWYTVYENIEIILKDKIKDKKEREKIINDALEKVELLNYKRYYPDELSGGMKQRVSIARALAIDPELFLMDEPFSNLDFRLKVNIIKDLIDIFEKNNSTGIFVTHDYREAYLLCDEIYIMSSYEGTIIGEISLITDKKMRNFRSNEYYLLDEKIHKCNFKKRRCNKKSKIFF
jgi:ABC-type nitrate/sulfonate/bicarbonate transport system ATPase subunit